MRGIEGGEGMAEGKGEGRRRMALGHDGVEGEEEEGLARSVQRH